MFAPKPDTNAQSLKFEIDRLFDAMADHHDKTSPEYAEMAARAAVLYPLRETDSKVIAVKRVSPDAVLSTLASFLGIVVIVGYEQKGVITSQAMKFIRLLK